MEVKGKILAKKSDNKAFKCSDDNWYNLNDGVVASLEKLSKGDEIIAIYEKKGTSRYVSKLDKAGVVAPTSEVSPSTDGFKCAVCSAPMKTGKFKVCYLCNKKGLKAPGTAGGKETGTYTGAGNKYDNPEKTAQIQRGNALNAAGTVASGCGFSDPDTAAQFVKTLADSLLEWLRAE
jgi:hypothetical protein